MGSYESVELRLWRRRWWPAAIVPSLWEAWLERRLEKQGEIPEERRLLLR